MANEHRAVIIAVLRGADEAGTKFVSQEKLLQACGLGPVPATYDCMCATCTTLRYDYAPQRDAVLNYLRVANEYEGEIGWWPMRGDGPGYYLRGGPRDPLHGTRKVTEDEWLPLARGAYAARAALLPHEHPKTFDAEAAWLRAMWKTAVCLFIAKGDPTWWCDEYTFNGEHYERAAVDWLRAHVAQQGVGRE